MKIGIVGTGMIVEAYLEATMKIEAMEPYALYSRDDKSVRVNELCSKFGIKKSYDNYEKMLLDQSIDFVYIASPNSLHYEQAKAALKAHKNVIVEKPFTSNQKEARELKQLAKANYLYIFEAMTTIHTEAFSELNPYIHKIGVIRSVQANCSSFSTRYLQLKQGLNPNILNPQFSGGALMDLNIYNISFVVKLFGKPLSTYYHANKYENGIDTSGCVIMNYPTFTASCVSAKDSYGMNYAIIQGEKGYINIHDGVNGMSAFDVVTQDKRYSIAVKPKGNRLYDELYAFSSIITNKELDKCYELLEHTINVIEVLDEARSDAKIKFPSDQS